MLTDLEIVNNALGRLGCERIASLSDNNKRAKLANDFLESSKLATLEMCPWSFATKRTVLSSTGTPAFEYTHSFTPPTDLIKIIKEYDGNKYKEEDGEILAYTNELKLVYTAEIDETTKRTPTFDKAWYLVLASEMAYSLTQNNTLKADLLGEAELLTSRSMSLDAMGSTPVDYEFDAFIDVRY